MIGLGGDGTILRALKLATEQRIPVLGVNLGRLAFLAEVNLDELPDALDRIDRGEHWIEERAVMTVQGTCFPMRLRSFNDSALSRVPGNGPAALAVEVEGEIFARYTADALVIATPTGSTAYSFAAGGPIVSPRHRGLLVTPVAPHAAFDRAVFLHPDEGLRVHVLDRCAPLLLEADGQRVAELHAGDCIEFGLAEAPGADPAAARPGLLRARAAQAADHRLLGACPAVNRRGRERRGRPAPAPVTLQTAHALAEVIADPRHPSSRTLLLDGREAGQVDLADPRRAGLRLHAADRRSDRCLPARRVGDRRPARRAAARARCRATWRRPGRTRARSCGSSIPTWCALAREHLGLRGFPGLRVKVGDAAEHDPSRARIARADLVIGDAFDGPHVPASLSTPAFADEVRRVLRPAGRLRAQRDRRAAAGGGRRARRARPRALRPRRVGGAAGRAAPALAGERGHARAAMPRCRSSPLRRAAAAAVPREQVLER